MRLQHRCFPGISQNFYKHLFWKTSASCYFCIVWSVYERSLAANTKITRKQNKSVKFSNKQKYCFIFTGRHLAQKETKREREREREREQLTLRSQSSDFDFGCYLCGEVSSCKSWMVMKENQDIIFF